MAKKMKIITTLLMIAVILVIGTIGTAPTSTQAASHREAPLISMDPEADITDFFFFRSYEPDHANNVVMIMDVIPGEEPSAGPNYFNFDPNVLYTFNVDNNLNGKANDVQFQIQFSTEFRGTNQSLGLFLGYVALPPITALDGKGSEGLGIRQKYTVTMVKNGRKSVLGSGLIAVPSNVGPRTMPDYAALTNQGIYSLKQGSDTFRVYAGQREDPFYIDLGGVFDTLHLRRAVPALTAAEDANDKANPFGTDMLSGFNVNTIALEVPAAWLTSDGKAPGATAQPVLGAYASTSRQRIAVLSNLKNLGMDMPSVSRGGNPNDWVQIQRLANPLMNEAVIGLTDKDRWNFTDPSQEGKFQDYYLNPRLAVALQTVFNVPAAETNRTDLVNLLLKYKPSDTNLSELLRLNLKVDPVPLENQHRLGPLAHDASGASTPDAAAWPNGRRPVDDVTDVAIRVVGGPNYIQAMAGDGINTDDASLPNSLDRKSVV
jgi:hypothetical protein